MCGIDVCVNLFNERDNKARKKKKPAASVRHALRFIEVLILIALSSGSIRFALPMQRIMDHVMRVPV